jgi:hypothetical protein
MATVKKSTTRKAPTKKAAPKIVIKAESGSGVAGTGAPALAEVPKVAAPAPAPVSTLTPADFAAIADIAATAAAEAVRVAMAPQKATVSPGIVAAKEMTPEVIAQMTDEEIEEFNAEEARKAAARKAVQAANLQKLEGLSTGERARAIANARDPDVIRVATPPGWAGTDADLVRVICKRRIGLNAGEMSDLDEVIDIPRESAKALQKTGVIEVQI